MTLKNLVLWAGVLVCFSPLASAATIYLKDGSQVRGTVVGATALDVQVQTDNGAVRIETDRIQRIDYSEAAPAPTPTRTVAPAPAPTPSARPEVPYEEPPSPYPARRRWRRMEVQEPDYGDMKDSFSFDFGLASPMTRIGPDRTGGSSVLNGDSGARFGVEYLHEIGSRLSAGVDVHIFDRNSIDDNGLVPIAHSEISGDTFMTLAVLKYSLSSNRFVRPYVLAGVGPEYTSLVIDARPNGDYIWPDTGTWEPRRLMDDAKWGVGSRAALGLDFHPDAPFVTALEIGWIGAYNGRYKGTPDGQYMGLHSVTGSLSALSITARWGWRF